MSDDAKGFDAGWLTLREPADHAARDEALTARLTRWARLRRRARGAEGRGESADGAAGSDRTDGHGGRDGRDIAVLDLGCGTGSNVRFLMPHLGHGQRWRLVDNDPALLAALPGRLADWCTAEGFRSAPPARSGAALTVSGEGFSATLVPERVDLAAGVGALGLARTDVVTASALLDLCSAEWIDALVGDCVAARVAGLFTLDYDGGADWTPAHADDAVVRDLVNRHQARDKGFGRALGPAAGERVARRFEALGHDVASARSVWRLDGGARALHAAFVDGWAGAATEQDPASAARIDAWLTHRRAATASEATRCAVGHHDVLALPPDGPA